MTYVRKVNLENPDVRMEKTIRGQKFVIRVKELESPKWRKKKKRKIGISYNGSEWFLDHYTEVYSKTDGVLRKETTLPPLDEQLIEELDKAMSECFTEEQRVKQLNDKTQNSLDIAESV